MLSQLQYTDPSVRVLETAPMKLPKHPALVISLALCGLFFLNGCEKPRELILTKSQIRQLHESLLTETPKMSTRLDINFDGQVRLLGVDIPKGPFKPGKHLSITWYWEALEQPPGAWTVFGHLEQRGHRQLLDHEPVRGLHPIARWEKGQIIRDVQRIKLDSKFDAGEAILHVGLFNAEAWKQGQANDRMPILDAGASPGHKDHRAEVVRLPISTQGIASKGGPKKKKPPRYTARKVTVAPVLDGKLDEAAWKQAFRSRVFLRPDGRKGDGSIRTRARMLWSDTHLHIGFEVKDADIASPFTRRDETLWKADVVEVFLDPDGDGKDYLEIQVAPTGALFDAHFTEHRKPSWEKAAEWNSTVQAAVHVDGTLNLEGDNDTGWSAEISIPFADIPGVETAPTLQDRWTMNLFRIDQRGPRSMTWMRAWAPIGGDFHALENAGIVTFGPALPATRPTPRPTGQP